MGMAEKNIDALESAEALRLCNGDLRGILRAFIPGQRRMDKTVSAGEGRRGISS